MRPSHVIRRSAAEICIRLIALSFAVFPLAFAQPRQSSAASSEQKVDRHKPVTLLGFEVTGTRFPAASIIRLSGLKVGQTANYDVLVAACSRITSTGLVSAVDYAYKVQPGKPGVIVSFKLWDELPLLPASIDPPNNQEGVWACLQSADPLFTRELPNTKAALHFYSTNIDRCLANAGHADDYTSATVPCDGYGKAIKIVFNIREKQPAAARDLPPKLPQNLQNK